MILFLGGTQVDIVLIDGSGMIHLMDLGVFLRMLFSHQMEILISMKEKDGQLVVEVKLCIYYNVFTSLTTIVIQYNLAQPVANNFS